MKHSPSRVITECVQVVGLDEFRGKIQEKTDTVPIWIRGFAAKALMLKCKMSMTEAGKMLAFQQRINIKDAINEYESRSDAGSMMDALGQRLKHERINDENEQAEDIRDD